MLTVQEAFDKFRSNLEIKRTEEQDASKRQIRIREIIRDEFSLERDFLSGSYKRDTKIRPLKDVDIFCVLGEDEEHRRRDPPGKLLEAVRDALLKQYDAVEVQRRSVSVEFPRGEFEGEERVLGMDVVPAFSEKTYYVIPDKAGPKDWVRTNPEIHAERATAAHKAFGGKWKPVVKMVKKWNAAHEKPIQPSFLIEVMALQILHAPYGGSYAREIKNFMATMELRLHETWPDPAGLGPPVSDRMGPMEITNARKVLATTGQAIDRAYKFERNGNVGGALLVWRDEVFGGTNMFPLS